MGVILYEAPRAMKQLSCLYSCIRSSCQVSNIGPSALNVGTLSTWLFGFFKKSKREKERERERERERGRERKRERARGRESLCVYLLERVRKRSADNLFSFQVFNGQQF